MRIIHCLKKFIKCEFSYSAKYCNKFKFGLKYIKVFYLLEIFNLFSYSIPSQKYRQTLIPLPCDKN